MTVAGAVMVQDGRVTDGTNAPAVQGAVEAAVEAITDVAPTLEFVGPMAGFPEHRQYVLIELEPSGMLCRLQSLDDPALRFLVLPPAPFFPDFAPEISDDWAQQLQIKDPADALVLLIITTGSSAAEATANLLAPIVVNPHTRRAAQIVLDDPALPLRAPLRAADEA